jgi:hypothetical protein
MSGYCHARKVTVTECSDRALPAGYQWLKQYRKRFASPLGDSEWQVKSDAPGFAVSVEWFGTLTEARKHARAVIRAGRSTWAEVFRYCEHGQGIRAILWAEYERELIIK